MAAKHFTSAVLAGALVVGAVGHASAQDGIVGGIIGGIIGGAIVSESQRQRTTRTTRPRTTVTSATRQQNRETQTALNYFDFGAGTPDGVLGPNSRRAIARYQAFMGYPDTGQLTAFERDFLVNSYQRAMAGGPTTMQMIAANPHGTRGLLLTYRDQMVAGSQAMASVTPPLAMAEPEVEPEPASQLPSFFGADGGQPSLASHCNRISLLTNANGGFTTLETMSDPAFALNEQFCLARTYAIAEGEQVAARVQGVSQQQIVQQCEGFVPPMRSHIAALSLQPRQEVLQGVSGYVLQTGMSPAQLSGTAKICLSAGYRTDNMDVALASALLLVVVGEQPYGELLGHHLVHGFGTSERRDLATGWYDMALDAVAGGQRAVFAAGQPGREDLIRRAAFSLGGSAQVPQQGQPQEAGSLPVFTLVPTE